MGKPYSLDLRQRVVAAVLTGGMSRNQAAQHFDGFATIHARSRYKNAYGTSR